MLQSFIVQTEKERLKFYYFYFSNYSASIARLRKIKLFFVETEGLPESLICFFIYELPWHSTQLMSALSL